MAGINHELEMASEELADYFDGYNGLTDDKYMLAEMGQAALKFAAAVAAEFGKEDSQVQNYLVPSLQMAIDDNHGWVSRSNVTFQDLIDRI